MTPFGKMGRTGQNRFPPLRRGQLCVLSLKPSCKARGVPAPHTTFGRRHVNRNVKRETLGNTRPRKGRARPRGPPRRPLGRRPKRRSSTGGAAPPPAGARPAAPRSPPAREPVRHDAGTPSAARPVSAVSAAPTPSLHLFPPKRLEGEARRRGRGLRSHLSPGWQSAPRRRLSSRPGTAPADARRPPGLPRDGTRGRGRPSAPSEAAHAGPGDTRSSSARPAGRPAIAGGRAGGRRLLREASHSRGERRAGGREDERGEGGGGRGRRRPRGGRRRRRRAPRPRPRRRRPPGPGK